MKTIGNGRKTSLLFFFTFSLSDENENAKTKNDRLLQPDYIKTVLKKSCECGGAGLLPHAENARVHAVLGENEGDNGP